MMRSGGVNEVDVLTNLEAVGLNNRAHKLVNGSRANCRFYNNCCSFRAYLHHLLNGSDNIASIHLLA